MNTHLRRAFLLFVTSLVLLSFSSCKRQRNPMMYSGPSPTGARTVKLVKPADAADLEKRIKAELVRRYERQYTAYTYRGAVAGPGTMTTAGQTTGTAGMAGASTSAGSAVNTSTSVNTNTPSYSGTNVQEHGVDEGDLAKTDGKYIYLARGTRFFILSANPAEDTAVVSDTDLLEQISELYLSGHKVVLITSPVTVYPVGGASLGSATVIPYRPSTRMYIYDVSAPDVPVLAASFDFPGYARGSRNIGNILYLITNTTIDLPAPASPSDFLSTGTTNTDPQAFLTACEQARQENIRKIETTPLSDLLPVYTSTLYSGGTGSSSSGSAAAPATTYIADPANGTDLSMVVSLDLSTTQPTIKTSSVLTASSQIYMSPASLYLASTNSWLWIEPMTGSRMPESNPEPGTTVHKFFIDGSGTPVYRGSGSVGGWINDRFSMGDYQGYLRVGTTRGGWWGEQLSNQLAVLGEDETDPGALVVVGSIKGLAPGERIYSMRFDKDRGYMVTFKQTDPLFTLNLRDPKDPRLAGELNVNGFATYIHLVGTDRLLTIGRSADATGRVTGNKLQLFDVSDLTAPRLAGEYDLGSGWSDALYDPHAFLYYEPLGMLSIPYYSYAYSGSNAGSYASGLHVFTIGTSSITLKGFIPAPSIASGYGSYQDTVDRSVIIDNAIFSIAHRSVTAADAGQLNVLKTVQLPESYPVSYGSGGGGTTSPSQPVSISAN